MTADQDRLGQILNSIRASHMQISTVALVRDGQAEIKICRTCKASKPVVEFYRDTRRKSGRFAGCIECNNKRSHKWYEKNGIQRMPEYVAREQAFRKRDPCGQMLKQAKIRASKRGMEFSICKEDVQWNEFCPVLGLKLVYGGMSGVARAASASLDRVDNSKGYVPGNVVVISHRANSLKRDASLEELECLVTYLKGYQNAQSET